MESLTLGTPAGTKPVSPRQHCLVDYVFSALFLSAPTLFGLTGTTAALSRSFGLVQLATNALTDTPAGLKRVLPIRAHGLLEKWSGPALVLLALATGGARRSQNLQYLVGQTLLASGFFNLTDWNGDPEK